MKNKLDNQNLNNNIKNSPQIENRIKEVPTLVRVEPVIPKTNTVPPQSILESVNPISVPDTNINNVSQQEPKKSKKLLIILLILIVIAIGTVITLFVIPNNKTEKNNTNTSKDVQSIDTPDEQSEPIYHQGFDVKKVSGYVYQIEDGVLMVSDSSNVVSLVALGESYQTMVSVQEEFRQLIETEAGVLATNPKIDTYDGVSMLSYEINVDGKNALSFVADVKADNSVMFGTVINKNNNVKYDDLKVVAKILKSVSQSPTSFSAFSMKEAIINGKIDLEKSRKFIIEE